MAMDPALRSACLGHIFTHREFSGGVLGLAWVGGVGAGGICDSGGLNTGFTTSLNYGSTVPVSVLTVTTAHEVGHNFGFANSPALFSDREVFFVEIHCVLAPQVTARSLHDGMSAWRKLGKLHHVSASYRWLGPE